MALTLYMHPLASFCQKVLIAFYENGASFEPRLVDLGNPAEREAFQRVWPPGQFPVLRDQARDRVIPESTIIIEYLAQHYPGKLALVPSDPELALETRRWDRFFDLNVDVPMQKVVTDTLRPEGQHDPFGVEQARQTLRTAYDVLETHLVGRTWANGAEFSMADCAAAPALFYARYVISLDEHPHTAAYYARLEQRPSCRRVVDEARPWFHNFPLAK
jgi:glutathione S-transferase